MKRNAQPPTKRYSFVMIFKNLLLLVTMLTRNLDRSALVGTEAMAAMGSSVRRFPSRGASRCLYRSQ